MADDNEFLSRKERDERIKNIEYQLEEEQKASVARQEKEKTRLERTRKREAKKAQERLEAAEKQKKVAEAELLEKKKQQQEAREIMEQKRQSKVPKEKANVTTTSTDKQIKSSATSTSASNLAKDNVSTELYIDGKKVSERDLPQDLVNQIRKEQKNAIRQTENEINDSNNGISESNNSSSDDINGAQSKIERDILNSKLRGSSGIYTSASGNEGGYNSGNSGNSSSAGLNGMPAFGVDVQKSKPTEIASGKYGSSSRGSSKNVNNASNSGNDDFNTGNNGIVNNNSEDNGINQNNTNISDRDALRSELAGLNNSKNISGVGRNSDSYNNNLGNSSNKKASSSNNAGIFLGAGAGMAVGVGNPVRNKPTSSARGATAGRGPATEGRDLDSELSNRFANNMGRMSRIAGGAAKKAGAMAKTVKTAMKTKKFLTLGAFFGIAGIIIIILILLVGAISFIMNMPGMVRDKIVDTWDNFWQEVKGTIVGMYEGQDQPTYTVIKNLAEYLESMGYDLEYNGFVTKLEKDKDENIKDIESKYLAAYIAAEQRSYLIANENYNVKGIWKNVKGLFSEESTSNENWGTGMIVLGGSLLENIGKGLSENVSQLARVGESLWDFFTGKTTTRSSTVQDVTGLTTRVIIKRDTKEMYISNVDIIDVFNTGGYDVYRYSLKEWTEKYGTPTELFLTLHLATRAPEFAYKFATTYDTKVYIDIKKLTDVDINLVYAETDQNNKIKLDENGKPIMKPISEMPDDLIKSKGISETALAEMRKIDNKKVTAFTPYITKVVNHWYYQQIIYQGEYNDKNIDVYEIKNLAEGDDGYVRYYAYTRRDNADSETIKKDSEKVELAANSTLWGIYNLIAKIVSTAMTGGYAGISGLLESASEAALNEAYGMISDYVVDEISSRVMGLLPDQLAGMLNINDFLKGNLSLSQLNNLKLNGINLNNMTEFLDFNKITESLSLNNLQLDVNKMWEQLNLQNELLNMDIAGLGSINDLQGVVTNLDLSNLDNVFSNKFGEMVNLSNVNFDKLTNQLVGGFSSSIESIQKSIVNSCDTLFSGLSEADFNKISDRMLGDITKQISDITATPIIDQLTGSIQNTISGKFNGEILSGLQNEFSKQLTGLSYTDLSKMASIQGMDFNQIKDLSGQVTSVTSALKGTENSIDNLSIKVNKLSKDMTGMDTSVLASVSKGLKDFDSTINTSKLETQATKTLLKSLNTSTSDINALNSKLETLENKLEQLQTANNQLDIEKMNVLQNEIDECKRDIVNTTNKLENLDEQALSKVQTQVTKLENNATKVVDNYTSLDTQKIQTLKYKLAGIDKTGIVDLATNFNNLDVSSNGMQTLVRKYGDDLTGLKTSEINTIMNTINGQNTTAQGAINGISKYLMRADETELATNLAKLNSTVGLLSNATDNLDVNKVATLVNKVPGFDSLHLNNFAGQISGLENASLEQLLGKVEKLPEQLVQKVSNALAEKITAGVKDQISQNLSQKLKGNMLNSGNFSSNLKAAMTGGKKQDMDMETEDQAIDAPYAEYSTGFYVREIRHADYFQKAEPLRVLYPASHWIKMFREDKYVILDTPGIDMSKIEDKGYIEKYGKTIWEATGGNVETGIYAMLQGIQSSDSQYLFRYFKELFNDMSWVFDGNFGFSPPIDPNAVKLDTIGWIFKTAKIKEPVFVGEAKEHSTLKQKVSQKDIENIDKIARQNMPKDASYYTTAYTGPEKELIKKIDKKPVSNSITADDYAKKYMPENAEIYTFVEDKLDEDYNVDVNYRYITVYYYVVKYDLEITYYSYEGTELQEVEKAEYEPYTWSASKIGILNPKSIDPVYGFKEGLDIVSPVDGVVVAKTEAKTNELGDKVAQSVTIELRDTGDANADGMRIILIGGDYSSLMVGSLVKKVTYEVDEEGNYTGNSEQSVIGKTTDETIKIMVLDKDQTPVNDVSEYIHPPYEQYKPEVGDDKNEQN